VSSVTNGSEHEPWPLELFYTTAMSRKKLAKFWKRLCVESIRNSQYARPHSLKG
jgi:hypothetical protein